MKHTIIGSIAALALLFLPQLASAQDDSISVGEICTNTCNWAGDGECDDGGVGAQFRVCAFGSDCNDCGPRNESQHRGLKALGGLPFGGEFRVGLGVGLYSADHEDPYNINGSHKQWIPLASDGMALGLHGRWVGLVRHTYGGNHAGVDIRFGFERFVASVDGSNTELTGVDDGQLRYNLYADTLLRFDRPFGRRHGLTLSFGPGFSLRGVAMIAELSPRIGLGSKLAIEPRVGIQAANYSDRELHFGADITIRASQKIAVALGYMMTLGELIRGPEHSYNHNDISVSVQF